LATSGSTCSRPSFVGQPGIFSSNPRTAQDAFNSFSRPFFRFGSAPNVIAQLTTRALHSCKARSAKPPTSPSSSGWGEHMRTVTRCRPWRSDFGAEYFTGPTGKPDAHLRLLTKLSTKPSHTLWRRVHATRDLLFLPPTEILIRPHPSRTGVTMSSPRL